MFRRTTKHILADQSVVNFGGLPHEQVTQSPELLPRSNAAFVEKEIERERYVTRTTYSRVRGA